MPHGVSKHIKLRYISSYFTTISIRKNNKKKNAKIWNNTCLTIDCSIMFEIHHNAYTGTSEMSFSYVHESIVIHKSPSAKTEERKSAVRKAKGKGEVVPAKPVKAYVCMYVYTHTHTNRHTHTYIYMLSWNYHYFCFFYNHFHSTESSNFN